MSISVLCACGHRMNAPDGAAGRTGRCAKCGERIQVPVPAPVPAEADDGMIPFAEPAPIVAPRPIARPPAAAAPVAMPPSTRPVPRAAAAVAAPVDTEKSSLLRRQVYWLLLLALIPLAWSTLDRQDTHAAIVQRIAHSVELHPESAGKLDALSEHATKAELCDAFPDDRIDGALLPERTYAHWGFAGASAAIYLGVALLIFPRRGASVGQLAGICAATATFGILLLLAFQWLAFHMPLFTPRGLISILLDLVWLIGQSYRIALGDHGFALSFLGFTAGVGLCEEACKALPLMLRASHVGYATWRAAMLWGLVSGIGFGVSEGVTYAGDSYNGIEGAQAYLVRFVSCVALHGIWSATVGLSIFRYQDMLRGAENVFDLLVRVVWLVLIPMILHGLYDTLLKQDRDAWALLVAVASFGWLAWQVERAHRDFGEAGEMTAALARG